MLRPCNLTQKQEEMFHRYCNSSATSLHDVYESWSDKKEEAYKYCLRDMKEHDGQDMRITGANGFAFSCAYRVIRDDGAYLVYHTRCNRFEFKYMEERE
jgi:hypothetical protein